MKLKARRGFTLVEMLVVMWAMSIAMLLGVQLVVVTMKVGGVGQAADNRTARRAELARDFRYDVAHAVAAPEAFGGISAGASVLFLQMPDESIVTYRWRSGVLERVDHSGGGEVVRTFPQGPKPPRVEFRRPVGGVITLRLVETTPNGRDRTADLSAALGGDLR